MAIATKNFPRRRVVQSAREIPQGGVDQPKDVDGKLVDAVELPHSVPEPFALQRICPYEFVAQDALHQITDHGTTSGARGNGYSLDAFIGLYQQDRRVAVVRTTGESFAPRELRPCAR